MEFLSDLVLLVDPAGFRDPGTLERVLLPRGAQRSGSCYSLTGTFKAAAALYQELLALEGERTRDSTQGRSVHVCARVLAFMRRRREEQLQRVVGEGVVMEMLPDDSSSSVVVTFKPRHDSDPPAHADFILRRFITFYQRTASDLQTATVPVSLQRCRELRAAFPQLLFRDGHQQQEVTVTGNFVHVARFKEHVYQNTRVAERSTTPEHNKASKRSRTPEHITVPERSRVAERSRTPEHITVPERSRVAERSRTLEHIMAPEHAMVPECSRVAECSRTPGRSNAPERSRTPECSIVAERSRTPERSNAPERSTTPERSNAPERSRTPERSNAPECSRTPERSNAPERSRTPERSNAPEGSRTPECSRAPDSSRAPERITAPKRSRTPECSRVPGHNPAPERSRTPECSRVPEHNMADERSRAPERSTTPKPSRATERNTAPEHIRAPEHSKTPELSRAPKCSTAPERSKAALEHIRAPERSRAPERGSPAGAPAAAPAPAPAAAPAEDMCPICMDAISDRETLRCKHAFCRCCLETAFSYKPVCPTCGELYGVLRGTQPEGGTMSDHREASSLPGNHGYRTIVIHYRIPNGIQKEEHPNPGEPYEGISRRAYLPDSAEGRQTLTLLRRAFQQRLVFTVGRSSTSGRNNAVTWNDIHHKTSTHGGPTNYGYPDAEYLSRVQDELRVKGIE